MPTGTASACPETLRATATSGSALANNNGR